AGSGFGRIGGEQSGNGAHHGHLGGVSGNIAGVCLPVVLPDADSVDSLVIVVGTSSGILRNRKTGRWLGWLSAPAHTFHRRDPSRDVQRRLWSRRHGPQD